MEYCIPPQSSPVASSSYTKHKYNESMAGVSDDQWRLDIKYYVDWVGMERL